MQDKFNLDTVNKITSFLTNKELSTFSRTCSLVNFFSIPELQNRKWTQLIKLIWFADTSKVARFLNQINFKEDYWQIILKKDYMENFYGKYEIIKISPLAYAGLLGDQFMVELLLKHVQQEGMKEALTQLKAIQEGIEFGKALVMVTNRVDLMKKVEEIFAKGEASAAMQTSNALMQPEAFLPLNLLQYSNASNEYDFLMPSPHSSNFNWANKSNDELLLLSDLKSNSFNKKVLTKFVEVRMQFLKDKIEFLEKELQLSNIHVLS